MLCYHVLLLCHLLPHNSWNKEYHYTTYAPIHTYFKRKLPQDLVTFTTVNIFTQTLVSPKLTTTVSPLSKSCAITDIRNQTKPWLGKSLPLTDLEGFRVSRELLTSVYSNSHNFYKPQTFGKNHTHKHTQARPCSLPLPPPPSTWSGGSWCGRNGPLSWSNTDLTQTGVEYPKLTYTSCTPTQQLGENRKSWGKMRKQKGKKKRGVFVGRQMKEELLATQNEG